MGMSNKAYARHRGVSPPAVRRALEYGRIMKEPDGTIDPVKADRDWAENTIPSAVSGDVAGKRAVPAEAIENVLEILRAEGQEVPAQPGGMSFIQARTANEIMKAQERKLKLDKMRGELVDRAKATALFFNLGRQERDAWMNWPVRVAALIAAETNADVHAVQNSLDKYVRQQLAEMAGVEISL